ncbi:MAG: hypothetical protein JWM80_3818 [Cyanobacteria bacterium RYN_339]|nr:hypothetical protein [Cyanobacteria bacterium RYN_339]
MKRALLACLLLTACGTAPHAVQAPATMMAAQGDSVGSYLSLEFAPTAAIAKRRDGTLKDLGFLDVSHAIPPRDPAVLHATVAFFHQALTAEQVKLLEAHFKGKQENLAVSGWGVAGDQVAFMTVTGVDKARVFLKDHAIDGAMDDPHVTIGVSAANPRDVHGVPKLAQHPFTPLKVHATYQLYQPAQGTMTARWQ